MISGIGFQKVKFQATTFSNESARLLLRYHTPKARDFPGKSLISPLIAYITVV